MPVSAVPDPANDREETSDDIGRSMQLRDQLVAELQQAGALQPACTALLEQVAEALRMAAKLREAAEEELFVKSERSGRSYAHPGIAAADVEVRRAALLLGRIHAMAKPAPAQDEPGDVTPLDELDERTRFADDPATDERIHRERRERARAARAATKGRK